MFFTKSYGIPFLLISTVTTATKHLHNFVNMSLMVTVFETLCTHNGVIFKNAIVTLEGFLWIYINTFGLSWQYFGTYIAFCLDCLEFRYGKFRSESIVYEFIEIKIIQNHFCTGSIFSCVSFQDLYNRPLIIVFIDSLSETTDVKHSLSKLKFTNY